MRAENVTVGGGRKPVCILHLALLDLSSLVFDKEKSIIM